MTPATALTVVVCVLLALGAVVATIWTTRPDFLLAATARRSETTGLPLGSPEIVDALVARLRMLHLVTGTTVVTGMAVVAAIAPFAADGEPRDLLTAAPFVFIAVAAAITVVTVSRPLIYSRAPLRAALLPPWLAIATAGRR